MALFLLLLSSVTAVDLSNGTAEDLTPASSSHGSRNFNQRAVRQYLEETYNEATTKQGPVLFPNDAPPPPRPPLIVTSRPLIESIARSELNPTPEVNNSIAESTQIKPEFRLRPGFLRPRFLAKSRDYKPFVLPSAAPLDYGPYSGSERYNDYDEEHTSLPPIYKAIADAAKKKVLKLKVKKPPPPHFDYQEKEPNHAQQYQHNDVRDDIDYDHNSNYAFSYTVKDHKTGDDFSHSQHSSGSATNGEYRVRLPDGRMQIVSYTADENGYKADVRYDDEDKTAGNSIDHYDSKNDYDRKHDYDRNRHDYVANRHDYDRNKQDYITNRHDYDRNKYVYVTNRPALNGNIHDYGGNNRDYTLNRNQVTEPPPVKEDYNQYTDLSREYYNTDYSSLEYDGKDDNYTPHKSKFASFVPNNNNLGTIVVPSFKPQNFVSQSTVRPSYEELKPLFVTKNSFNYQSTEDYLRNIELSVPSTTPSPNYEGTTEHVVVIGTSKSPNLYTNIRNVALTATPSPVTTTPRYVTLTPQNYLVSTIASLKNGQTPVLSGRFIDKINKYLTFT